MRILSILRHLKNNFKNLSVLDQMSYGYFRHNIKFNERNCLEVIAQRWIVPRMLFTWLIDYLKVGYLL